MVKKSDNLRFVIVVIVLFVILGSVSGYFLSKLTKAPGPIATENNTLSCNSDSDCVPDSCCHPKACVAEGARPDCGRIACTMECAPGTLDCGQGSCKCIDNKCGAVLI